MKRSAVWILLTLACPAAAEDVSVRGLVLACDATSLTVQDSQGKLVAVRCTPETLFALKTNWRQLANVRGNVISYRVHSANQTVRIPLPAGARHATKTVRPQSVDKDLQAATAEKWLSARGLRIYARTRQAPRLPTKEKPVYAGTFTFAAGRDKPAALTVGDQAFEVSMNKGGQTDVLIFDVLTVKDCKPYVNVVNVIARADGKARVAREVHVKPIGDQAAGDDLALPRLLFIGDSISGNYGPGLRKALAGKVNAHHPPTNCGSSAMGVRNVYDWLGAFKVAGRDWDVISFNFGHWDAGNTKAKYQANLEFVIAQLRKTGAKLIWVTTCPVPDGYDKAGELVGGRAPSRRAGVMAKYLNPWAAEVVKKYPEIAVCDQWQLVKDNPGGIYTDWWKGKNVHFSGQGAEELGRLLAKHVLVALGRKGQ